jgi:hypothetical protein
MRVNKGAKFSDIEVISIDKDAERFDTEITSSDRGVMAAYIGAKPSDIKEM